MNTAVAVPDWALRLRQHWSARLSGLAVAVEARRHVRVLQAMPLGPGNRLLVVEFAGQRLLIGQGRTGLVRLADDGGSYNGVNASGVAGE